jgi:hypothetical protein
MHTDNVADENAFALEDDASIKKDGASGCLSTAPSWLLEELPSRILFYRPCTKNLNSF